MPEHWVGALGLMIEAFVFAVRGGDSPPVTGEDNLRVIEVIEAAYRSSAESRRVSIDLVPVDGR